MSAAWTHREVREALGLGSGSDTPPTKFSRITTDSRDAGPGDLFVALNGERFDGHDFVGQAVARGATGAVVEREPDLEGAGAGQIRLFQVPDTLLALGALARYRRENLRAQVVGITGSSGKTSTKELLAAAVRGTRTVHATPGNLNNRIGLPLTLLGTPPDAHVLVLEMGTNEPGEIQALTEIAGPVIGVITTVSETHLENLGSLEGVLEEKLDLFRGLPSDGTAVAGDEPPSLEERAMMVAPSLLLVGQSSRVAPEHRPEGLTLAPDGCFRFRWRGEPVELQVPGRHSVQNALLALAVSDLLGVSPADATRRVGTVRSSGMRSEIRTLGNLTLVVDCYNANPQSLKAALDLLVSIDGDGPRVAVLGSMLELGKESRQFHLRSLQEALDLPLDLIVAMGLFAEVAEEVARPAGGPELSVARDLDHAGEVLMESLGGSEVVLLKASRGVALERLIPNLEARFGPGKAA